MIKSNRMRGEINKKGKWGKPEIMRINLRPEQAVLSCCDQSDKAFVDYGSIQCWSNAICDPSGSGSNLQLS